MVKVAGLVPFTTIDFPNRLAAVIFTQGCVLNCPYCHNPQMQDFSLPAAKEWTEVLAFLASRKGLLDGVVLSGGEPLAQPDILSAIEDVAALGLDVALHTSGALPDKLRLALPHVAWIGLDIKGAFDKYDKASGTSRAIAAAVQQSLDMILSAHIPFEARTTTDPRIVTKDDILSLARLLKNKGVKEYALQEYRPAHNGRLPEPAKDDIASFYTDKDFMNQLKTIFPNITVRRAS